MLKAQEILNGLQNIVNGYSVFAVIWHVIFYALIIALLAKWQPTNRLLGTLMFLPLLSVAILAWISGNPFNGTLFSILSILILIFGLKASTQPINMAQLVYLVIGVLMVVFGLIYPHFIDNSLIKHLYLSPVGLIPCPTLSILIGFVLIFNGFGSQSINLIFIIFGLFYGIFGVLKLAVYVDLVLVFGTITLLIKYIFTIIK
jgi:hypothetical protein